MFFAAAMVCLFATVIPVEPFTLKITAPVADEMQVKIHIEGDIARRYLENAEASSLSAAFRKNGNLLLTGVANTIDETRVRVTHTSLVRVVGKPTALLSMETVIDRTMIAINPDAEDHAKGQLFIRLANNQPVEIRVRPIAGGFPDSPRYH